MPITQQAQQARDARRAAIAAEGLRIVAQVVNRFGVTAPTARDDLCAVYSELPAENTVTPTCPHCGATMDAPRLAQHIPRCPEAPGMVARVREALEDPDKPGHALSVRRYAENAARIGAPGPDALRRCWGDWPTICGMAGLGPGRKSGNPAGWRQHVQRMEAAAIREVEEMLEADERLRESLRDRGLEVCDGYKRMLPNGGVAYMLR